VLQAYGFVWSLRTPPREKLTRGLEMAAADETPLPFGKPQTVQS